MEDLTGKAPAPGGPETQLTSVEWNNFFQELKNYIEDQGFTMSVGDLFQLQRAVAHHGYRTQFLLTAGGTANVQTASASATVKGPRALVSGLTMAYRPVANNTSAAPTLNVQSLGAIVVLREDGSALLAGDASLGAPAQALPDEYIKGLTMGRNAADLLHDVAVQVGICRDQDNLANMALASIFTKRFDATLAEGNSVGGYPLTALGARQADTPYRYFLVRNADGTIDGGWDSMANADAAGLLADMNTIRSGWSGYRQIGHSVTSSVATELRRIANVPEDPNLFRLEDTGGYFVDNILTPKVQTLLAVPGCPPGAVAKIEIRMENDTGGIDDQHYGFVLDTESGNPVPTRSSHNVGSTTASETTEDKLINVIEVKVDASGNINHRWANVVGAEVELYMRLISWRWER
jgi:hypothetical protein